jgi:predicted transcriptional regulator
MYIYIVLRCIILCMNIKVKVKIFTQQEHDSLRCLYNSYTKASAETLFSNTEIILLKYLLSKKEPKNIVTVSSDVGISRSTTAHDLRELEKKGVVRSENDGRSIMWSNVE